MIVVLQTPATMTHALDGPDAEAWQASLDKELASIDKAGTWILVNEEDIPASVRPIDSRLVLALKMDPTGGDNHICKTRLVAKGFSQRPGIDFYDTFSPVGHRQSFRQLMTIVADLDLEVQGLDIATAFLHGDLEEEIYMKLPKEVTKGKRQVARLRKALYGLKQAGRCWNDKIDAWLRQQGWKASPEDPCLYVKPDGQDKVEMLLYIHVDDSVIAAKDNESIDAFVDYCHESAQHSTATSFSTSPDPSRTFHVCTATAQPPPHYGTFWNILEPLPPWNFLEGFAQPLHRHDYSALPPHSHTRKLYKTLVVASLSCLSSDQFLNSHPLVWFTPSSLLQDT
jgi:hypothetical protein